MFNLRVYGILIIDEEILICDESYHNVNMTKFCGGGLELGEGTIDCLKREFMEEMNLEIEIISHFYTTDFYQKDAFRENSQLISIYYLVKPGKPLSKQEILSLNTTNPIQEQIPFRFVTLNSFTEDDVTMPVDKYVARLIKTNRN